MSNKADLISVIAKWVPILLIAVAGGVFAGETTRTNQAQDKDIEQ